MRNVYAFNLALSKNENAIICGISEDIRFEFATRGRRDLCFRRLRLHVLRCIFQSQENLQISRKLWHFHFCLLQELAKSLPKRSFQLFSHNILGVSRFFSLKPGSGLVRLYMLCFGWANAKDGPGLGRPGPDGVGMLWALGGALLPGNGAPSDRRAIVEASPVVHHCRAAVHHRLGAI